MRCVVQRVLSASVSVGGQIAARIGPGLVALVGVAADDQTADIEYVASKIQGLRIFRDEEDRMNRSVVEIGGAVLAVPQFTLFGDVRRGRRPAFDGAAPPDLARGCYDELVARLRSCGLIVETGVFRANMHVALVNDGPVTILLDSKRLF
jgi:D-tyrosyl-tRNA(Tyr) deacylase